MTAGPEIQAIIDRDFPPGNHPYRMLERAILDHVDPGCTVLDIGCGRRASNLMQLKGRARTLIGIDLVDFELTDPDLLLINADVCDMRAVPSDSVDLSYSRSVMEHIKNVGPAYWEINRVLKPGGKYIFLTPNAWDYASIIAYLVPNRFHCKITRMTEGRQETEVFPTFYQSNTFRKISRMAEASNFTMQSSNTLVSILAISLSAGHCSELDPVTRNFSSATGVSIFSEAGSCVCCQSRSARTDRTPQLRPHPAAPLRRRPGLQANSIG